MRRNVSMNEISDGRFYGLNDMVKADCQNCEGCFDCCTGMGESVVLDPLDVHRLSLNLKKDPKELLYVTLQLDVVDGNILPHLRMEGPKERCQFLNEKGRCSIHPFRPGICRLFPLGRYYENGSFSYFLQIHECRKQNRAKIKVKKWIDTPDLKQYEAFVTDWHYFLKDVQAILEGTTDPDLMKNLNLYVLSRFYLQPYEEGMFYPRFFGRLEEARELLALEA